MICAYDGDVMAGVICTLDRRHISNLYVDRAYQRKGIATELLIQALEDGICPVSVNAAPTAYEFYKKMHEAGIQGYVRYDFKPAPSLVNQTFSLKLTLAAEDGHYLPQNSHVYQSHQEVGVAKDFELKFVPGKRPTDKQNAWNYSYIEDRDIPFESQDRQTQLALINKKFNFKFEQTFADAFDASANN